MKEQAVQDRRPPSFVEVLGTVWKVIMAILLIPFLILLAFVALKLIVSSGVAMFGAAAVAVAAIVVMRVRR